MTCDKNVLKQFYGDESGNGTRSKIISDIRAWTANNKGHRIIIGAHLIGKSQTIDYSLKDQGVLYFYINNQTDVRLIDSIPRKLINQLIIKKNGINYDLGELLENKAKEVRNGKTLQDKYFSLKDLISLVRIVDPRLSIVFIYKSKSKLETELYDAFVDNECQFIFKVKVDKNELSYNNSVTLDSIILEADDFDLWPLSVEEAKKMIRGEHPEVEQGVCGISPEVVKRFFSKTKLSLEDLIIKIVGCHPYLLYVLCGKIIDRINSPNYDENPYIEQFLCNLIKNDYSRYNIYFKNFFCNIKKYRNDLYNAYEKWIKNSVEPEEYYIDEMKMFGMIYIDNQKNIPILFREYIIEGTTRYFKNESLNNNPYTNITKAERRNPMSELQQKTEVKEGIVYMAGRDILINNGVQNKADSEDMKPINESKKKILILAANPKFTPQNRLDEEIREIYISLQHSKHRERFEFHSRFALRLRDLRKGLLDVEPQIVHFIGHGKKEGLLVEDELGMAVLISPEALADLFSLFSGKVECVILGACYSAKQAVTISKHIDYVIGMKKQITDKAAIEFSAGFYDALGARKPVEEAFKFGCNAIKLFNLSKDLIPILKVKKE